MAVFETDSFLGLSDYENKGTPGTFKFGRNLDVRKHKDTLSAGQALIDEGLDTSQSPSASESPSLSKSASASLSPSVSPSQTPSFSFSTSLSPSLSASPSASESPSSTDSPSPSPSAGLTTVFEDLIHFYVPCEDGYTYGFGNTGNIYRRDVDGYWDVVYRDADGAIKGAYEWYSDTGRTYLYWATDRTLKRKLIPGLTNWNDVTTVGANLTSARWHPMREAGGSLIICNGPYLALVGYDDSYTNEAVSLRPGNIATTLVERDGRSIIGTARISALDKGVNAAIDSEVPLAQIGEDGEVFFADGANSVASKRFPGGGKVNPGGVANQVDSVNFFEWEQDALSWIDKQTVGNMSMWGVFDAESGKNGVYTYGRKNKNKPFAMNLEYGLEVDEIGAVIHVDDTTLISYRDGTNFGVKRPDTTKKAIGTYEGLDFKAPVKKPANITVWDYAKIFCSPLPEHTSIQFWYRTDKSGEFKRANTGDDLISYGTQGGQKAVFRINDEGKIFEQKIVTIPADNNTPEIHKTEVHFH